MHPLDELWGSVDNELPDNWHFDGLQRGLLSWIATAANYTSSVNAMSEQRVSASSESPIKAIQDMIAKVRLING